MSFNFYYDIQFWVAFGIICLLLRAVSRDRTVRDVFLLASNVIMLLALPAFGTESLTFVCATTSFAWIIGWLLRKDRVLVNRRGRILVSFFAVLLLTSVLVFFKYRVVQEDFLALVGRQRGGAAKAIFIIGISYFSFKMIHFVVESYKRQIKGLSMINFFNYALFFPSFISGPITRYNDFCGELRAERKKVVREDLKAGSERVVHGLFKKFVLCPVVWPYVFANASGPISELGASQLILGMFSYTLYIYFDFAGYSDIAIGSSRMLGIGLPENFNRPFLKKNIQELWANWHMSLTRWLTDYIYWPLARSLRKSQFLARRPILLSNICIIVTFIVCGMWHGESWNFVVWGLYHGLGLACLNIYQKYKRKVRNKSLRKYFSSEYSKMAGRVLTFGFFVVGILLFSADIATIKTMLARMLGF
jgi:D-alanyl-lipoteichoic acid acyltransferase DltB (MBOAT superfamily)